MSALPKAMLSIRVSSLILTTPSSPQSPGQPFGVAVCVGVPGGPSVRVRDGVVVRVSVWVARCVKDIVLVGLRVRVAVGPRGVAVGVGVDVGVLPTRTTISRGAPKFPPLSWTRAATMVLPSRNSQALAICAQY